MREANGRAGAHHHGDGLRARSTRSFNAERRVDGALPSIRHLHGATDGQFSRSDRNVSTKSGRRAERHGRPTDPQFPTALAEWVWTHRELLESLGALRRLGDEGREAVEAISAMRSIATVRESWALWEALTEGDGEDPEVLLLEVLSPLQLESAHAPCGDPGGTPT